MKISSIAAALAVGMFLATPVWAEDSPKGDAGAKEARAAECSKQADAKGLHGKERKKFREECKKGK